MQRCRLEVALAASALLAVASPALLAAEALPIFLDGTFADWTGTVEHTDPTGDAGSSGIDLTQIDLANDETFLFLRFRVGTPIGLQDGINDLVLYLDTDLNAGTGLAVGGIGAELEWRFGDRGGTYHPTAASIRQADVRLRSLPSVTSSEFEVAIGRSVRPDGVNLLFPGSAVRILLRDEFGSGDRAPNTGQMLTYTFDSTPVGPPPPHPLARQEPADVRIVTWNVPELQSGSGFDPAVTPAADRVLSAIDPDVICFQEVYNPSAAAARNLIESFLPSGPGEAWHAAKVNDNIVVSRFPIVASWTIDANLAVHLDADAILGRDVVVVCAHLPCCTDDSGRQDESDAIMAFWRDAMTPGGAVNVPAGTAFVIAGDLNLVGDAQQLETLLTGDVVNEATHGPDFAPDWDGSGLADVVSRQVALRFAYTWRNDNSTFAPGRLDFIIHTDAVLELGNHFIVYTPEMDAGTLAALGLQAGDVTTVADHLPHVADLRPVAPTDTGMYDAGDMRILGGASPAVSELHFALQLARASRVHLQLFDVRGRVVADLGEPVLAAGVHGFRWDGCTANGDAAPAGVYIVRVTPRTGVHAAVARKAVLLR